MFLGDRRRRSALAEKRDDDEVSGTEAGPCAQTLLPHRQAQTESVMIRCGGAKLMTADD